jgi:hypothetical protein
MATNFMARAYAREFNDSKQLFEFTLNIDVSSCITLDDCPAAPAVKNLPQVPDFGVPVYGLNSSSKSNMTGIPAVSTEVKKDEKPSPFRLIEQPRPVTPQQVSAAIRHSSPFVNEYPNNVVRNLNLQSFDE